MNCAIEINQSVACLAGELSNFVAGKLIELFLSTIKTQSIDVWAENTVIFIFSL